MQVDSKKPMLKAPKTKRLKLTYDKLLSSFAFNFNLRRYTAGDFFFEPTYPKALAIIFIPTVIWSAVVFTTPKMRAGDGSITQTEVGPVR